MPRPEVRQAYAAPYDWLTPDWPAPAHVRALCTTRAGGVSVAPWDSLNLGEHVADDPATVKANRAVFTRALALSSPGQTASPVFMNQVHGTHVESIRRNTPDGIEADACTTQEAGVACVIMVADCLPVLFTNAAGDRVAAAHAGWRGLAGSATGVGVLEEAVQRFDPSEAVFAWLGPCIGSKAFEVGAEVRAAFCDADASAEVFFSALGENKFLADLAGIARHRLERAGVRSVHGNDGTVAWCTFSNPSRFFSYRRDQRILGGSGRLAAAVWIDG
ncbi:peptidoglycan editing factor PgeF [Diaphorobacter aerolatus]|uniref:Purine nucleoside phosphorylase n=1 Tax=Diaphorobacter aerolatus TaxID=1288495 RepID=A0A7H0GKZ7_9BURK|nr:peptidoglycan editing factor PgeF [Diaphorobacter aerolatus]QNP48963.1 peptidoglycan editing factor PgeF [Diaphorobacter aerolatus]